MISLLVFFEQDSLKLFLVRACISKRGKYATFAKLQALHLKTFLLRLVIKMIFIWFLKKHNNYFVFPYKMQQNSEKYCILFIKLLAKGISTCPGWYICSFKIKEVFL